MIITQTTPLIWHIADDDHTPVGVVDKDGDVYVALRHGCEIVAICPTLQEAAESYFKEIPCTL